MITFRKDLSLSAVRQMMIVDHSDKDDDVDLFARLMMIVGLRQLTDDGSPSAVRVTMSWFCRPMDDVWPSSALVMTVWYLQHRPGRHQYSRLA